jgi:hypothetical protein
LTFRRVLVTSDLGGWMLPTFAGSSAAGSELASTIDALLVAHDRQGIFISKKTKNPSSAGHC